MTGPETSAKGKDKKSPRHEMGVTVKVPEKKKLIAEEQVHLLNSKSGEQSTRQEKFAEFLRTEKLKKYKRVPRVYGERNPVAIKCPNCSKER